VWAFFFSYDTRLLMPVYPLLALCAAGGMAHVAERTRWPRAWSRVGLALGVVMVLLFAGYAVGAPQGARYAWAPYRACFRVHPLASDSREIRERLVPGMRAVEAWKVKWPLGNTNRYWAMDPRLLPYFDDRAVDGRGAFLLPYVGGEAPWLDHDLVLLPADTDSATTLEGDWLRDLLQRGRLGRVGEAGGWAGYVVAK
jgi:hypothetical protein